MKKIIQNQVKCNKCKDEIFSKHRHDFVRCKCGAIAVDGGMEYLRRVGAVFSYEEQSLYMEAEAIASCIEALQWAEETGRNKLGATLAVIRVLKNHNLLNLKEFTSSE